MVGEWNTRKFRQNRHVVELSTRAKIARFSLFDIHNNIIDRAFQNFAELVYCRCADRLIMPQPVYRTAADVMFGNQRVGRYFVPVEVIPKRFVCYHCRTSFRKTERKNPSGLKFPLDI